MSLVPEMRPLVVMAAFFVGLTLAIAPSPAAAGDRPTFVYSAQGGPTFTVTDQGLSEVRINGELAAEGEWTLGDAGTTFPSVRSDATAGELQSSSLKRIDDRTVRVEQVFEGARAVYTYGFDGEDVRIKARVENHHRSAELTAPSFGPLMLRLEGETRDNAPMHSVKYIKQGRGLRGYCYPSHMNGYMGVYTAGETFGVGMTPTAERIERVLFWRQSAGESHQRLRFITLNPVPPEGAVTIRCRLRFSDNTDWKHLLVPYKEAFWKIHKRMHYRPDFRPWASFFGPSSPRHVRPDNPLGYNGSRRRLDTEEGVDAFCDHLIPKLKEAGAAGVLMWQPQGWEPRGQLYRSDFQIWPPQVREHLPELMRRFKEADLRLGLLARPAQFHLRVGWKQDWTFEGLAENPATMRFVWQRFKWALDQGFDAFYLDSVGNDYNDVKIMQALRKKLGPDVQTFIEHDCDAVLPYSGVYSPSHSAIYDWLMPYIVAVHPTEPSEIDKKIERGTSPLVADYKFGEAVNRLRELSEAGRFDSTEAFLGRPTPEERRAAP